MNEEEILEILRTRLSLDVVTTSEYTGGMGDSGQLYSDSHKIRLCLDGEVISEVYL